MNYSFVATTTRGAEAVLAAELTAIGARQVEEDRGAVRFSGPLAIGYRACLWSRIASRVLLQLSSFSVRGAEDLYQGMREIPWLDHLGPDERFVIDFVGTSEAIRDSRFGAMKAKDGLVDHIRHHAGQRPSVDIRSPDIRINVHLRQDQATVSLDLSGEPLHLRSEHRRTGDAPLKENLAAALLWIADWPALSADGAALVDPTCGSGTFAMEAAGIALNRAPGLARHTWGFTRWRGHDGRAWRRLCEEARGVRRAPEEAPPIVACDADPKVVKAAASNIVHAGLEDAVRVTRKALEDLTPPRGVREEAPGLVVANPPYGERLGTVEQAEAVYGRLGDMLKRRFPGWTGWILAGSPNLAKRVGLKPSVRCVIHNGPIECRWLKYEISPVRVTGDGPGWRKP